MGQRARLVFWIALTLAAGCTSNKTSTPPPPLSIRFDSYAGSILSGPTTLPVTTLDQRSAWRGNLRVIALENDPGAVLESAGSAGRLIRLEQSHDAYQAVSQLGQKLRAGSGDAARDIVQRIESNQFGMIHNLETRDIALAEGVTTRINLIDTQNDPPRNVEVAIHRNVGATPQLEMQITVRDLLKPLAVDPEEPKQAESIRSESVLLDPFIVNQIDTVVVLGPRLLPQLKAKAIALILEIHAGDDSLSHDAAIARLMDEIHASDDELKARMRGGPWSGFEAALDGASKPETRRASLQFIAGQTGAEISGDFILLADSELLAQYTDEIKKAMSVSSLDQNPELLGWLMDRVALEMLAEGLSKEAGFSNELRSILLRRAGEAGCDSATMASVLRGVHSRQELSTRLIAENLIALEDTSPATRVRAYDWLASIGKAPANYDPLGPDEARRAALAAIEQ